MQQLSLFISEVHGQMEQCGVTNLNSMQLRCVAAKVIKKIKLRDSKMMV